LGGGARASSEWSKRRQRGALTRRAVHFREGRSKGKKDVSSNRKKKAGSKEAIIGGKFAISQMN